MELQSVQDCSSVKFSPACDLAAEANLPPTSCMIVSLLHMKRVNTARLASHETRSRQGPMLTSERLRSRREVTGKQEHTGQLPERGRFP